MSFFDNTTFTEKVASLYSQQLSGSLPGVKFQIAQPGATDWAEVEKLQILGQYTAPKTIALDGHMRNDGSIDDETVANTISSIMAGEIIAHAGEQAGSGKLWLLHETLRLPDTFGCAMVHIAKPSGIQFLGQTWYDANELKTKYLAKAVWILIMDKEMKRG